MKAALDKNKSALMKEFLQNILCLFDYCFSQAGAEKHSKYAISLEVLFAEKEDILVFTIVQLNSHGKDYLLIQQVRVVNMIKFWKSCCNRFFSTFGLQVVIVLLLLKVLKKKVK